MNSGNLKVQISGPTWALLLRHLSLMQSNEERQLLRGVHTSRTSLSDVDNFTVEERHLLITGMDQPDHAQNASSSSNSLTVGQVHFRRVSGGAPAGLMTLSTKEKQFIRNGGCRGGSEQKQQQQQQQQEQVLLILIETDPINDPATRYVEYGLYLTNQRSSSNSSGSLPPRLVPLHIINLGNTVLDFVDVAEMCSYSSSSSAAAISDSSQQQQQLAGASRVQQTFKTTVGQIESFAAQFDKRSLAISEQKREMAELMAQRAALKRELQQPVSQPPTPQPTTPQLPSSNASSAPIFQNGSAAPAASSTSLPPPFFTADVQQPSQQTSSPIIATGTVVVSNGTPVASSSTSASSGIEVVAGAIAEQQQNPSSIDAIFAPRIASEQKRKPDIADDLFGPEGGAPPPPPASPAPPLPENVVALVAAAVGENNNDDQQENQSPAGGEGEEKGDGGGVQQESSVE